jgi:hypothetical protein
MALVVVSKHRQSPPVDYPLPEPFLIDLKFSEQVASCPQYPFIACPFIPSSAPKKTGLLASNPVNSFHDVPGGSAIHLIGPEAFRPPVTRSLAFSVKIDSILKQRWCQNTAMPEKIDNQLKPHHFSESTGSNRRKIVCSAFPYIVTQAATLPSGSHA